jgi:hypothetical protein
MLPDNRTSRQKNIHRMSPYVVYANAHSSAPAGGSLYHFSLFESMYLLVFKTSFLVCNRFQIWGGVDNSILWLSFAQQKTT